MLNEGVSTPASKLHSGAQEDDRWQSRRRLASSRLEAELGL
ncbi:hypothetical protein [Porphyromonas sp. COT-239 OH1446]|nr:hypothetical protein [Porphyromonas sp. COT-239 OH1446]